MNALRMERQGAVARITLDRPDRGNAIDLTMGRGLLDAASACAEDPSVRCVLLTGEYPLFCAGGDVSAFADRGDALAAYLEEITGTLHAALLAFGRMDKPMVTAVNGPAAGAEVGLAAIGDIALAAPEAYFTLAYTAIGLSPDAGSSWLLPRLIGMRRTQELLLRNRRLGAEDAAASGLVTRVCAAGRLAAEATELAEDLAAGPARAFGTVRRLLSQSLETGFAAQLEAESRGIASRGRGGDGREGIASFVGRRAPTFTGTD